MALSLPIRYALLILLLLAVKNGVDGARRTVTECAAILEGPVSQDIEISFGNETSPVPINCWITCINNLYDENNISRYNPAVTIVADRVSKKLVTKHASDTSRDLYQKIEYTPLNRCVQAMDRSQHLYEIYPTVNANRSVVRCAVKYNPTGQVCLGESVIVIRYVNSTIDDNDSSKVCNSSSSTTAIPTPISTPGHCGCNDDTTTDTSPTTTAAPNIGTSEAQILGATLGTFIPVIVVAVVVLLLAVIVYNTYQRIHKGAKTAPAPEKST